MESFGNALLQINVDRGADKISTDCRGYRKFTYRATETTGESLPKPAGEAVALERKRNRYQLCRGNDHRYSVRFIYFQYSYKGNSRGYSKLYKMFDRRRWRTITAVRIYKCENYVK